MSLCALCMKHGCNSCSGYRVEGKHGDPLVHVTMGRSTWYVLGDMTPDEAERMSKALIDAAAIARAAR